MYFSKGVRTDYKVECCPYTNGKTGTTITFHPDVEIFKENFEKGVYQDEAEESISYVRSSGIWKDDLDKKANRNGELSMSAHLS